MSLNINAERLENEITVNMQGVGVYCEVVAQSGMNTNVISSFELPAKFLHYGSEFCGAIHYYNAATERYSTENIKKNITYSEKNSLLKKDVVSVGADKVCIKSKIELVVPNMGFTHIAFGTENIIYKGKLSNFVRVEDYTHLYWLDVPITDAACLTVNQILPSLYDKLVLTIYVFSEVDIPHNNDEVIMEEFPTIHAYKSKFAPNSLPLPGTSPFPKGAFPFIINKYRTEATLEYSKNHRIVPDEKVVRIEDGLISTYTSTHYSPKWIVKHSSGFNKRFYANFSDDELENLLGNEVNEIYEESNAVSYLERILFISFRFKFEEYFNNPNLNNVNVKMIAKDLSGIVDLNLYGKSYKCLYDGHGAQILRIQERDCQINFGLGVIVDKGSKVIDRVNQFKGDNKWI